MRAEGSAMTAPPVSLAFDAEAQHAGEVACLLGAQGDAVARHVLRQLQMHRAGPLLHGHSERLAHDGRDRGR